MATTKPRERKKVGQRSHRTTVSLAPVVMSIAEDMMEKKGYNNNFTAYVSDLIRRDRERHGSVYEAATLNDQPSLRPTRRAGAAVMAEGLAVLKKAQKTYGQK